MKRRRSVIVGLGKGRMMGFKNWKDLIDVDIPDQGPITEDTLKETEKRASRFRGSARASTRKIWITSEYEDYRREILNKSLP